MTPSRTYAVAGLLAALLLGAGLPGPGAGAATPASAAGRPVALVAASSAPQPGPLPHLSPLPSPLPSPVPTGSPAAGPTAVKGSVNNSNDQQAYGLPAVLALVVIGAVGSLLLRLLLAHPAGRRRPG